MIREIVTHPDPVLTLVAEVVDAVDEEIRELVADMIETMIDGDGVGLAAPQVGVSLRVIVVDVHDGEGATPMINPVIVERDGEIAFEEGCLSVPDFRISIDRSERVRVRFLNVDGDEQECDAENLKAVAIQHEIDHLDGRLIIDRASRLKQDLYVRKVRKRRREEKEGKEQYTF